MAELFVKLDCSYLDNEKMLQVSETAELLYLRMLTLSKRLMSDGRIVTGHLQRYGPMGPNGDPNATLDAAHELVQVGLWEKEGDGAWLIAGWMERNAASDEIETRSAEGRENALKRWHRLGKHKNEPREGCPECTPTSPPNGDPEGAQYTPPLQETETETETETEDPPSAEADEAKDRFEEHFWSIYPKMPNGSKPEKGKALQQWRKLTLEQQRRAVRGARNIAAADTIPKHAHRFLRQDTAGEFPFDDWQEAPKSPSGPDSEFFAGVRNE